MKKIYLVISIILLAFFGLSMNVNAQWKKIDYFKNTPILTVSSSFYRDEIIAGGNNGLFLSKDNGENWNLCGLEEKEVVFSLVSPGGIITGTLNQIFLLFNDSINWLPLWSTPIIYQMTGVANTGYNFFISTLDDGIFLLSESGLTPFESQGLIENNKIYSIASYSDRIAIVGTNNGLFLSLDYGKIWQLFGPDTLIFSSLFIDQTNGDIYAGAFDDGVFKSEDNGATWESLGLVDYWISSVTVKNNKLFVGVDTPEDTIGLKNGLYVYDLITTSVIKPPNFLETNISIYPNPFSISTTIEIKEKVEDNKIDFTLYNTFGQEVKRINNILHGKNLLKRDNLINGVYFYKFTSMNTIIKTGKLVIQ